MEEESCVEDSSTTTENNNAAVAVELPSLSNSGSVVGIGTNPTPESVSSPTSNNADDDDGHDEKEEPNLPDENVNNEQMELEETNKPSLADQFIAVIDVAEEKKTEEDRKDGLQQAPKIAVAEVVPADVPRNTMDELIETSSEHQDELNFSIDEGGTISEVENVSAAIGFDAQSTSATNPESQVKPNSEDTTPVLTTPFVPPKQPDVAMKLLNLPVDALHCIASFLNASEWANFGQTSVHATPICREVFRKVRMHGFRCATEIITAWKLGQHADARELSALYISSGVPVYPLSLGHSYGTLVWRMGVEAREAESQQENPASEDDEEEHRPTDPFYAERYESGDDADPIPNMSYLEEKCWFVYNQAADGTFGGRLALSTRASLLPPVFGGGGWQGTQRRLPGFRPTTNSADAMPQNIQGHPELSVPKVTVKVHRHLVDQHMVGRSSVNDENGTIAGAPLSLAADFFHPQPQQTTKSVEDPVPDQIMSLGEILPDMLSSTLQANSSLNQQATNPLFDQDYLSRIDSAEIIDAEVSVVAAPPAPQDQAARAQDVGFESPVVAQDGPLMPALPAPPQLDSLLASPSAPAEDVSIVERVELEIYHSGCASTTSDHRKGLAELKSHLKTRFGAYQRRLETYLTHNDSPGFEECILDFWDEFLPVTANIHFYDGHTAVPRISCLQKFLTKPCPKSIGIVQCEIERIKSSSKKSVKGRLFPTYEYRLFIRDRRFGAAPESSSQEASPPRRDTVLMMAKHRGRKHQDPSGIVPAPASSKKGVNNYYLYMAQQADIDSHHRAVNSGTENLTHTNKSPTETSTRTKEVEAPSLLGRLQSNFIGTEFQIFTPSIQKRPARKPMRLKTPQVVSSDSESDYDSGFSSDNATSVSTPSHRRSRFRRRRSRSSRPRGAARDPSTGHPFPIDEEDEEEGALSRSPSPEKRKVRRSYSLPSFSYRKSTRSSRRAVANAVDLPDQNQQQQQYQTVFCEEEDGAITYTANLLGNRPRIMDVCVPRVSDDGVAGAEWKRYLESVDDSADAAMGSKMLQRFKQLQQRLDNPDQNNAASEHDEENSDDDYTPPDDFGLLALQNRPPWWNIELGAFVLNFGGRVSVASVKNFQLCDRSDQDHIMLQFGRIQGRHSFTMDFQHPLTAVQAFAIAISSLQSRISFG